jgi:triacylglycerol lipase
VSLASPTLGVRCPPRPGRTRAWRPMLDERRGLVEARALLCHPVWRGAAVPRGDGLPVLLIPGTKEARAGELSLTLLSRWLGRMGYVSYRSKVRLDTGDTGLGAGLDAGPPPRVVDRLERRLRLVAEVAERPVALVGHGAGGQLAKALAIRRPDLVAGVISLGSPHLSPPEPEPRPEPPFPPDVPFTSIYSRSDGVVDWRSCLDPAAERVEVQCSHVGMAVHPTVYRVVARRLAVMARRAARAAAADSRRNPAQPR